MATQIDLSLPLPDGFLNTEMVGDGFRLPVNRQASRTGQVDGIRLESVCKPADMTAKLPASNLTSDGFLKMVSGTHGAATPKLSTADFAGASGTQGLRFLYEIPQNYEDGKSISVRVRAKWDTDVADGTNNLDVRAFLSDGMGGITGSDKCQTAVQNPTATAAYYTFVLSPTGLVAGDVLDIVVDWAIVDTAGVSVIGFLGRLDVLLQTQG